MNHAFLILAHDSPKLLQRIVDRLESPNHYFFIHLDKKSPNEFVKLSNSGVGGYLSNRVSVTHGGYSMLLAELRLLQEAYKSHVKFDYFHLISGHDYPCVSNPEFDEYFEKAPQGRSFMHFDTAEQQELLKDRNDARINKWFLTGQSFSRYIGKYLEIFLNTFVPRCFDQEIYSGWQWFSWHRSLVQWVLNYNQEHSGYFKRFRYTHCCDELVFHTLLYPYIDELNIDKDHSLRYIDWNPKREHKSLPLILDERDFDAIILSKSFFAEKCLKRKAVNF